MGRTQIGGSIDSSQAIPSRKQWHARPWVYWLSAVALAEAALVGAHAVSPEVGISALPAYALGFAAVAVTALGTSLACPLWPKPALAWVAVPACAIGLVGQFGAGELATALIVTAAILFGATLVGSVVGAAIEHAGHLLFVAIVSAAADIVSVVHPSGPSAAIAQSKAALSLLALPWPMLGTPKLEAFLGAGDVVFTALYVASSRRLGLSLVRTGLALTLGYAVTMVAVIAFEAPVPALPLLGLAMVLAHPEARRPPKRDRVRGFAIAVLAVGFAALLLLR